MRTLYLDTFSGISGDMFLGLLIDLGLPLERLQTELKKLPLTGYELKVDREQRHGIEGCRLQVVHEEGHHHRSWSTIDKMLEGSELDEQPKQTARRFFRRLGEAEAKVHGIDIDKVHFHEVGAIDAIVDLTGAAIGLYLLGIEKLLCSPLPLSRGMSKCAHGALPLPAPAVLKMLHGLPIVSSGSDKELVTPTGATIVTELAEFCELPQLTIDRTGYGVGGWQLEDRPNLLRGILGEMVEDATQTDRVQLLETHIDDSTAEQLGYLLEQLFDAGALDAAYSPLQMKKNRPAHRLTVACEPGCAEKLAKLIMHQSSAIGVRSTSCNRFRLHRRTATVATELGEAQVKLLYDGDRFLRLSAEYEDCRKLAQTSKLPLQQVYRLVENAAYQQLQPETNGKPA
ncbi:hypothetical protein SAMN02745165_03045 [Malonomonas rubra DSM 5091]|uniref:Putative nickel insertion protein n=1 Tax=Malonomonas rubra DSM 5091 TaxID=1122189 RepID=A0A1M6LQC6_MALRU|nr:nickel pincer cofactor biosynthesis protein LarC [Malonomonas rubra]SHJ73404.1 hypothetical protein SAMN02745165_03045 [Malonomonas rubra DSM 5091]